MNGEPLDIGHGAPLRLRVETQLGYKSVKWLRSIEFVMITRILVWDRVVIVRIICIIVHVLEKNSSVLLICEFYMREFSAVLLHLTQ